MAPRAYSFIDIAALDAVRDRFAAGDALALLSAGLDEVIWANGNGARLLGFAGIAAVIGASAGLGVAARRQIAATPGFPAIGSNRPLLLRLASGMSSRAVALQASGVTLPDGEQAILLAQPDPRRDARDARGRAERAIEGFASDTNYAALVDGAGAVVAASAGFERIGISAETLRALASEVAHEADRLVKRLVEADGKRVPAGIARLTDEPALNFLVVVDEDQGDAEAEQATEAGGPPTTDSEAAMTVAAAVVAGTAQAAEQQPTAEPEQPAEAESAPEPAAEAEAGPVNEQAAAPGSEEVSANEAAAEPEQPAEAVVAEPEATEPDPDRLVSEPAGQAGEGAATEQRALQPETSEIGDAEAAKPESAEIEQAATGRAEMGPVPAETCEAEAADGEAAAEPASAITVEGCGQAPSVEQPASAEAEDWREAAAADPSAESDLPRPTTQEDGWYFSTNGTSDKPAGDAALEPEPPEPTVAPVPSLPPGPIRFVWRTDANGRLSALSDEFAAAMGMAAGALLGRPFGVVADELGLDPEGEIARLLERRDTWSGRSVLWPVAGAGLRVPVDLAALPVYGRQRVFEGFRGFGVARTGDAIEDASAHPPAAAATIEPERPVEDPFRGEVPALAIVPRPEPRSSDKVISLDERRAPASQRALSPAERQTFDEIGTRLRRDIPAEETPQEAPAASEAGPAEEPTGVEQAGAEQADAGHESSYEERYETLLEPPAQENPADDAQASGLEAGPPGTEPASYAPVEMDVHDHAPVVTVDAGSEGEAMAAALEGAAFDAVLEDRARPDGTETAHEAVVEEGLPAEAQDFTEEPEAASAEPATEEMPQSDVEAEQPWSASEASEAETIDAAADEAMAEEGLPVEAPGSTEEPAEAQVFTDESEAASAEPVAEEMPQSDIEAEQPWWVSDASEAVDAAVAEDSLPVEAPGSTEEPAEAQAFTDEPEAVSAEPAAEEMPQSDVEAEQPWSASAASGAEAIDAAVAEDVLPVEAPGSTEEPAEAQAFTDESEAASAEPATEEMPQSDVEAEQPWSASDASEAIDAAVAEDVLPVEAPGSTEEPAEAQAFTEEPEAVSAEPATEEMPQSDIEAEQPWWVSDASEAVDAAVAEDNLPVEAPGSTEEPAEAQAFTEEPEAVSAEPATEEMPQSDVEAEQPWSASEASGAEAIDAAVAEEGLPVEAPGSTEEPAEAQAFTEEPEAASAEPAAEEPLAEVGLAEAAAADASAEESPPATAPAGEEVRAALTRTPHDFAPSAFAGQFGEDEHRNVHPAVLWRLPVALAVHSGDVLHHVNRAFLNLTGYGTLHELEQAGGLDAIFVSPFEPTDVSARKLRLRRRGGEELPVDALLQSIDWNGRRALLLAVTRGPAERESRRSPPAGEAATDRRIAQLSTIIDTATDGVVLINGDGTIRSISRPAEALFGFDNADAAGQAFVELFAIESQRAVQDYLAGLAENGVASVLNDGREVIGREARGRFLPLFMTIGRLPEDGGYCAVLRDITQWKRAEEDLTQARAQAERTSSQKTEFLARVSHEIRTPLNAIIGFSELMVDEKFGPISNERYRDYLRDINRSGNHVLDLVNDLLDISKIEAGQQEMNYEAVSLNEALGEAVAIVQPQANRDRVIIRSSMASRLPEVVADLRSIRQIALNLLSNAIRYTPAGGQVIVSTSYEPSGNVMVKVRDTGVGMATAEIEQALKPFKQINALKRPRGDGTGLGLPLTKAMVEANRARFAISSTPGEGTLVEITFPSTRVLAD